MNIDFTDKNSTTLSIMYGWDQKIVYIYDYEIEEKDGYFLITIKDHPKMDQIIKDQYLMIMMERQNKETWGCITLTFSKFILQFPDDSSMVFKLYIKDL